MSQDAVVLPPWRPHTRKFSSTTAPSHRLGLDKGRPRPNNVYYRSYPLSARPGAADYDALCLRELQGSEHSVHDGIEACIIISAQPTVLHCSHQSSVHSQVPYSRHQQGPNYLTTNHPLSTMLVVSGEINNYGFNPGAVSLG